MNSKTSLEELLARPCIADTSLLCNFVYTGYADLLLQLVGEPLFLSPTILDEVEATQLELERLPTSEFLRPLYLARQPGYDRYREAVPYIRSFAEKVGSLWNPSSPSADELFLARELCGKQIWQEVRDRCPSVPRRFVRRGLQQGEAEAVAIAISRGWTVLLEDQAAVELLRCLYPKVGIVRTCSLNNFDRFQGNIKDDIVGKGLLGSAVKVGGCLLFGGCDPVTTAIGESLQMGRLILQGESGLGKELAQVYKKQLPLVRDKQVVKYVREIGDSLAELMGRDEFKYEFYVVEDDSLNAFALPGGKVFIHTGTILNTNSTAELAGVIAHEIAHAVLSHGFKKVLSN